MNDPLIPSIIAGLVVIAFAIAKGGAVWKRKNIEIDDENMQRAEHRENIKLSQRMREEVKKDLELSDMRREVERGLLQGELDKRK